MWREIAFHHSDSSNNFPQLVLLRDKPAGNGKECQEHGQDEGAPPSIHKTPQRSDSTAKEKGLLPEIGSKPSELTKLS
jgi:hypothetical protein